MNLVVHDNIFFTKTAFLLPHLFSHRTVYECVFMHLHPLCQPVTTHILA
jgi:hypothetical protein